MVLRGRDQRQVSVGDASGTIRWEMVYHVVTARFSSILNI